MNRRLSRISVFLDAFGVPTDYYASCELAIYEKEDIWRKSEAYPLTPVTVLSISGIREEAARRLLLLENCRAVAAAGLSGIPYSVFTAHGLPVFITDHLAETILDSILTDVDEAEEEVLPDGETAQPVRTGEDGVYRLDLAALQIAHPEVSSKMALTAFFENTPFTELRLTCLHLPPWIARTGRFDIRPAGDGVYTIRPGTCADRAVQAPENGADSAGREEQTPVNGADS